MKNRPTQGMQHVNRIQFETTADGKKLFREYWIHEWDGRDHDVHEHVRELEQAIKRALELGYREDAEELVKLRRGSS